MYGDGYDVGDTGYSDAQSSARHRTSQAAGPPDPSAKGKCHANALAACPIGAMGSLGA